MMVYLGLYWLCKSFYPPLHTVSFVHYFQIGHELPKGLGQDVTAHEEVFACNGEGGHALVQLHLHLHFCPCP
jgi:hypothetical protein